VKREKRKRKKRRRRRRRRRRESEKLLSEEKFLLFRKIQDIFVPTCSVFNENTTSWQKNIYA